jgi:dolichol-phosphate mannosyltransferase
MKLLSIIFSFRNEEQNLNELMKRLKSSLENVNGWKYEYIFVNDDSTDNSEKILNSLQKDNPIRIVNLSRKFGVGPGVLAGFEVAKGDALVYMDSDLQDPPEIIPKLIEKFESGSDVVHTKRTKRLGEGKIKMLLTNIGYKIINMTANINLPVQAGDFKLLSRRAVIHINSLKEFNPYVRGLTVWIGFKQDHVEYVRDARSSGETKFSSIFSGNLLSGPIAEFIRGATGFSTGPLFLGIFIGLVAMFFSFLLIIYAIYHKFFGTAVPGSSGTIIAISFFSGIILTTIGIIGVYVARIYEQIQGRPRYIIKNIVENHNSQSDQD